MRWAFALDLRPSSQPDPEPVVVTVIDVVFLEVNMGDPMYFEFEKLDVYKVTLDFLASADDVAAALPKGRRYLKDQLRRGANSIAANLAEGVGEYSPAEKVRFYRISRRSAVECASHLLACRHLALVEDGLIARGLDQLLRIVAMQTSMIRSISARNREPRQR